MPLRAGVLWAAVLAGGAERLPGVRWQSPGCCVASADKFRQSTRMKDMDNIKTIKTEWMCKSGTEDEILNGKEQNCDYSIDNLFEEAQKVGDIYMPTTTVKDQVDVIIKLWKNGFTVSDGELRSYTDVANQQFLDCIKKGATPRIISKERDDHQGLGNRQHLPLVPLNDLEPITKIQIWLADGERIIQKFNVSHRISHVRDFIMKYQGSEGSVPFILTTSLPFRVLQDETLTLEEAKLQNAVVVQRLQKTTEPFRLSVTKAPDNDHKPSATPNGQLKNEKKNTIKSARSN
ncbi:UBX domain-containing protein 2A isoform X4 [Calypte anna]|uniref:UBX domain-containing protein 2A isoform X4 n=1 Tax=Calypte anna TaxID=9244 RepID=UPI0011C4487D|nr:UBX domain-containing protein 2A isoform X4 [Calypte anna]